MKNATTITLAPKVKIHAHTNNNGKLVNQLVIFTEQIGIDPVCSEMLEIFPGLASVSHSCIDGKSAKALADLFKQMEAGKCPIWNEQRKRYSSSCSGKLGLHSAYLISASGKVTALKEAGLKYYQHYSDLA
jgi:hypothetical protein